MIGLAEVAWAALWGTLMAMLIHAIWNWYANDMDMEEYMEYLDSGIRPKKD